MNDNFIFFRYNNDYDKNEIDLSPRTHISVYSKGNNKEQNKVKKPTNRIKKFDLVEVGLKKLITLGRQTKKYIPSKESILYKKNKLVTNSNNYKNKSLKKLTPFQVYEKNKKLFELSVKKNSKRVLNLKSFNSREFTNNNVDTFKNQLNASIFSTPIRHYNTISCNFKNKLIKSLFEKNKAKVQTINNKDEFEYLKPKYTSQKYLLSCGKNINGRGKRDRFINEFYIGKNNNLPIHKKYNKIKKKNETSLTNYNMFTDANLSKKNKNIDFNNFYENIYSQIPLVQLNSYHFSKNNINNLFIKKILSQSKNKKL